MDRSVIRALRQDPSFLLDPKPTVLVPLDQEAQQDPLDNLDPKVSPEHVGSQANPDFPVAPDPVEMQDLPVPQVSMETRV